MRKKVGILYQPKSKDAIDFGQKLADIIHNIGATTWICSSWEEDTARECVKGTDLIICLGGDGTILRAARIINPFSIPIASINLGRVGFMTDLRIENALKYVPAFIKGEGYIEERAMLEAAVISRGNNVLCALNDVFVGRGERCRLVRVNAKVNGELVAKYKCDGVIIATATGSTGYALAAGGPVLHPLSKDTVIKPVAAHLCSHHALILPPNSVIELEINTTHKALLSVDGQVEVELFDKDIIRVKNSDYITKLLKHKHSNNSYGVIIDKLTERE